MRLRWKACAGALTLAIASGPVVSPSTALGQDVNFRAVAPARRAAYGDPIPITLSRPQAADTAPSSPISQIQGFQPFANQPIARGQMGTETTPPITIPPPPAFPGTVPPGAAPPGRPAVFPGAPTTTKTKSREEEFNNGVVNSNEDTKGVMARTSNFFERCWYDIGQATTDFGGGQGRAMFQSDTCFNSFISPVTNPHLFEDPRALTELRPIFMWQLTPNSNYIYQNRSNFFADLQARVAFTPNISLVINRLGWAWTDVANPQQGVNGGSGLQELNLGPKFTFIRNQESNTVGALGLNFILPIGSASANQNTGDLSLAPYFSIAQGFGKSDYGAFNFMNTTGYSFSVDSQRTDFFYSSFHLDYDIGNSHTFYPLIELNWTRYTMNGSARDIGFEGNNLFNFGSAGVAGHSDLTMALGGRYRLNDHVFFGLAGEMNLLGGGRHMDLLRVTADMIIRY